MAKSRLSYDKFYARGFWSLSALGGDFVYVAFLWGYSSFLLFRVERCPLLGDSKYYTAIGGMGFVHCTEVVRLSEGGLVEFSLTVLKLEKGSGNFQIGNKKIGVDMALLGHCSYVMYNYMYV